MAPPEQQAAGHRRTVFGPTIDSIQRELLPALGGGVLEPEREAMVRSSVGRLLSDKQISHDLDVWGHDVSHDWPWWQRQLAHHLPRYC